MTTHYSHLENDHRKMNDLQRLDVLERRETPLMPSDVKVNAWVRVKGNLEYVKQLCANGFEAEEGGEGGGGEGENQEPLGGGGGEEEGSNSINKVMEGDRNLIMRLVGKMAWKIQSVNVLK